MNRSKGRVTLREVAAAASVSIVTASKALSGRMGTSHISEACIQRVRAAAEQLGYQQNYLASALRIGRSRTIGLSVGAYGFSMIGNIFWSPIAAGAEVTTRHRGYDLLLIGGTDLNEPVERGLRYLTSQRIDGLIVPQHMYSKIPTELENTSLPTVLIMGPSRPGMSQVAFEDPPGIRDAVEHLAQLGHRRAVWIGLASAVDPHYRHRAQVFRESCQHHGMTGDILPLPGSFPTTHMVEHLIPALKQVTLPADVTAVLCMNDGLALAALQVFPERGRRIPEDLSIIGFDDMFGDSSPCRLTTISHRLVDLGAAAANMVIAQVEEAPAARKAQFVSLPSRLIIGKTTGPARLA
jgi:LacI family transcriptional regulator